MCCLPKMVAAQSKSVNAQAKAYEARMLELRNKCNELIGSNRDVPENFPEAIQTGLSGLQQAKPEDAGARASFALVVGVGYYNLQQFDSAEYYFRIALRQSEISRNSEHLVWANSALMTLSLQRQRVTGADSFQAFLVAITDTLSDLRAQYRAYYALGTFYYLKSYYTTAQEYILKGLKTAGMFVDTSRDNRISKEYAANHYLLYKIYANSGFPDKALIALRKGSAYVNNSQVLRQRYQSAFVELYTSSGGQNNIDSAIKYYQVLSESATSNSKSISSESVTSALNIAQYYVDRKMISEAASFLRHADSLATISRSPFLKHQVQIIQGKSAYYAGRYDEAIQLLSQSGAVSRHMNRDNYVECLQFIARSYKAKGNPAKALEYFEEMDLLKDTLRQEVLSKNMADLEIRHRTQEKEKEIEVLNSSNKIKELELQSAARLRVALIIGLLVLTLIALFLYQFYRNKERLNKILNQRNAELDALNERLAMANESKAKLFGIFSHDLRSPISKIAQFLRLQKESPDLFNDQTRQDYHERFTTATAHLLDTMEDLLIWSKSQMEHFSPEFKQVRIADIFEKELEGMRSLSEEKRISMINEVEPGLRLNTDENFIIIIFRNLIQNAIRHSRQGSVITVTSGKGFIGVSNLTDNPVDAAGLNTLIRQGKVNSSRFGLGLQIVSDLAARLGLEIEFTTTGHLVTVQIRWQA
jgi:signal transduction histidine kinase